MKNKVILIIFIVLIVSVCIMIMGCTLSNDSGNNSNFKSMDASSETEVDEDLSDKVNMEEVTIIEKIYEEDYKKNTSSESGESSIELYKDEKDKDKSNKNTSQNDNEDIKQITSNEETESDDIGGGIVLPDDEW